jgi:hypothetical protein
MNNNIRNFVTRGIPFWQRPHLSRRVFFQHLGSAVGGYFLLPTRPMETVAKAAPSLLNKANYCIFIFMDGGPSHIDTFDHKVISGVTPNSFRSNNYGTDEDTLWFPGDAETGAGLLGTIASQLDSVCLLRSTKSWTGVHELGQIWAQIGRNPASVQAKIAPHIGSVVSLEMRERGEDPEAPLPKFLSMNGGRVPGNGYFHPRYGPFFFTPDGNPPPNTRHPANMGGLPAYLRRYDMLLQMDADLRDPAGSPLGGAADEVAEFTQQARRLVHNDAVENAFTLDMDERRRYAGVDQGGELNNFANSCLATRNLIRDRLGPRFFHINTGGWDNHDNIYTGRNLNADEPKSTGRKFDFAVGNLIKDLKDMGLLDQTLIVAMGEFGRTVGPDGRINGGRGRDHYQQQGVFVAGAQIQGPKFIGKTDPVGGSVIRGQEGWRRATDRPQGQNYIRAEDIEATIYSALGIDYTIIRRDDPLGRGFEYVPVDPLNFGPIDVIWE